MSILLAISVFFLVLIFHLSNTLHEVNAGRIVGGQDAPDGFSPWQVSLQRINGRHYASGVIINNRWILTCGHCLDNVPFESIIIYIGSNKWSEGGEFYKPLRRVIHEDYDPESYFYYDVGLIRTEAEIRFNPKVQPIALARSYPPDGALVAQTGWGSILYGGPEVVELPDNLQLIYASYIATDRCTELSVGNPRYLETQVCTQPAVRQGLCFGDSGGPTVYFNQVISLTSYTWNDTCGSGYPEYTASVPYFYDWIQEKIQADP